MTNFLYDQGALGEGIAGWQLAAILNGEAIRETMRGEGMGALDLQIKFPVLYPTRTYHQIAVQVKTGRSFATWTPSKKRWRLNNIDKGHVEKWRASNQPVLLLWVRLDPNTKIYWKLITSNTPLETLSISESLNPAARFEIERLLQIHRMRYQRLPLITVPQMSETSEVRGWARPRFRRIQGLYDCALGRVSISNYAWRHLTRVTRSQSHIKDSLTALPYVRSLLDKRPHQLQTMDQTETVANGKVTVSRKVLAIYRDVRFSDKGTCATYIRLDEQIVFPANWRETGMIRGKVTQELRLESVFRKPSQ